MFICILLKSCVADWFWHLLYVHLLFLSNNKKFQIFSCFRNIAIEINHHACFKKKNKGLLTPTAINAQKYLTVMVFARFQKTVVSVGCALISP